MEKKAFEEFVLEVSTPPTPLEISELVSFITLYFLKETKAWKVRYSDKKTANIIGVLVEYALNNIVDDKIDLSKTMWQVSKNLNVQKNSNG